jgi:hypothetical protein
MQTEALLTDGELKRLRIVCISLASFSTLFNLLCIYLGQRQVDPIGTDEGMWALRMVNIIMTVILFYGSKIIAGWVLSGKIPSATGSLFSQRYATAIIIQLAMVEASALFAGVIFFMTPPLMYQNDPTIYLHLLPVVLLLVQTMRLIPTPEKIVAVAQRYNR